MQPLIKRGPLKGLRLTDTGEAIACIAGALVALVVSYGILAMLGTITGVWQ